MAALDGPYGPLFIDRLSRRREAPLGLSCRLAAKRGPCEATVMRQRVDFVTLRVEDLEAATRYYVDGLGWRPLLQVPGEVSFFQIGHGQVLSLFAADAFDADSGGEPAAPITLAHNVDSPDAVRAVVDQMVRAGGRILKAPQPASWGGFHALVQDPSGFGWEIAHNPGWSVAADGTVSLGPAGE